MEPLQGTSLAKDDIEVRHCAGLDEFRECVRLERQIWGEDITVPTAIFVVAHHSGGQVLGAFEGGRLIGFTLALAGYRDARPLLHSHMTAVAPEAQSRGVGRRLKLAQREDALRRGIRLVEWTFDPLELKNARFNLVRLGAIARRYIPDCYGITGSPLHAGLPTDRLVAEWWLDSERVRAALERRPPAMKHPARISLSADIAEIKGRDRKAAARVQSEVRRQFLDWLSRGYAATSFEWRAAKADYLLEPAASILGLPVEEFPRA